MKKRYCGLIIAIAMTGQANASIPRVLDNESVDAIDCASIPYTTGFKKIVNNCDKDVIVNYKVRLSTKGGKRHRWVSAHGSPVTIKVSEAFNTMQHSSKIDTVEYVAE